MAYAATIDWWQIRVPERPDGTVHTILKVAETGAGSSSEWDTRGTGTGVTVRSAVNGKALAVPLPLCGTILLVKSELVSGTGTTIQPTYNSAAGGAVDDTTLIAAQADAATFILDQTPARFSFDPTVAAASRNLFSQSNPDAGSDNVITSYIVIVEGMQV